MNKRLDRFDDLSLDDLDAWVGNKILSRGQSYQKKGRVSDLAVTDDDSLIAFVEGTERYATEVDVYEAGQPHSACSCSHGLDCKHGVAVVIEYLECVKNDRPVPEATEEHPFYAPPDFEGFDVEEWDDEESPDEDIIERRRIDSDEIKSLIKSLRKEILEFCREPGWLNDWEGEGCTPDYSGIRSKIDVLVKEGYADEALDLGEELLNAGMQKVEETDDDGETAMEVSSCVKVLISALERSSLTVEDRLTWAVDVVLEDEYCLFEAFGDYLLQEHDPAAWSAMADRLLARLEAMKSARHTVEFTYIYHREKLIDWIIHALEHSGRTDEIIPLCESEAKEEYAYERLVAHLITRQRYDDAERWIQAGIRATENKWGGIAGRLRDRFIQIRTSQEAWPALAAILVEEFVRHPSSMTFLSCQKSARKVRVWPKVRELLLVHLESGEVPWRQKNWPLPESGLELPEASRPESFPMYESLINIAIMECNPDKVLYWYDKQPRQQRAFSYGLDEERIADAIHQHAPERAVGIWKKVAEGYIYKGNRSAYRQAATYLRKAAAVMIRENKQKEWDRYLLQLRELHIRKRRLVEILDGLKKNPIVDNKR